MVSAATDDPHALAGAIRELLRAELPRLVELRHDLHMHPEVGYEEVRTSGVVRRELDALQVHHVDGMAGGTGVLAHLPGAAPLAVALRADMDALPILEAGSRPWASRTPGRMHACGHDGHTAILLGAAAVLSKLAARGTLPNPVTLVFQPAEEGGGGGQRMADEGALDGSRIGPRVAEIYALHGWPELPLGHVATRPGPIMAASDRFEIEITGTGAHAAWPHRSADPIVCAAATVTALQSIVARNVDPLDAAVVSVTVIESGSAFNVIPGRAVIKGTYRSLSEATRSLIERRLVEATNTTYRLSQARFRAGIDSYLTVLDAQRASYAAEQGLLLLEQANLNNQVEVYKTLGGGLKVNTTDTLPNTPSVSEQRRAAEQPAQ